jgi:hypothetical protein
LGQPIDGHFRRDGQHKLLLADLYFEDLEEMVESSYDLARVGYSYLKTPVDVRIGDWAVLRIKNKTVGGATIAEELGRLKAVAPKMNAYVVFKVRGKWYCAETLEQFKEHMKERNNANL